MRFALAALLGVPWAMAQSPQLVWEGAVDGISVLYVRGSRVDTEVKQGRPVQRLRYRFYNRLPDSRQNARVVVREGRGAVGIAAQPRLENNYTLAVTIEDRQGGSGFYSLEFYWDTDRGSLFDSPPPRRYTYPGSEGSRISGLGNERITWSGRVDEEAVVECRGDYCQALSTRGVPATRERASYTRPLPAREVQVSLAETQGRGEIRLLEQPSERNGYAARVLIRDPQGGAGDYSFALVWTPLGRMEPERLYTTRGMVWYGRVDARVRVIVQGDQAWSEVVHGTPVAGERAVFDRPLPAHNNLTPALKRLKGRGRVEIVEYPSNRNGYRLVFEITDTDGGADNYEIEVGW